jgi:heme-degrading monooxygenase HmoA
MSTLVDRESGRCIVTTAWRSEDAMRASAQRVVPIRDRAAQSFGAERSDVGEWEIALLHRDHRSREGACCRVTWVQGDPPDVDRAVDAFKLVSLPVLEDAPGFCSASLMINRAAGRGVTSVAYDSLDAMTRSREMASDIRTKATSQAGVQVVEVREFELAMAHLRAPEMA